MITFHNELPLDHTKSLRKIVNNDMDEIAVDLLAMAPLRQGR